MNEDRTSSNVAKLVYKGGPIDIEAYTKTDAHRVMVIATINLVAMLGTIAGFLGLVIAILLNLPGLEDASIKTLLVSMISFALVIVMSWFHRLITKKPEESR